MIYLAKRRTKALLFAIRVKRSYPGQE